MTDYANEEWLSIKMIDGEEEAELIEGFLTSREIPCQLESRYSHEFPTHLGHLAEIELKVPASRAEEARELLASRERTAAEPAPEATGAAEPES